MYRGMIEGAEWAKEGTYLREKIKQYQLDKVSTGHGRVWRLTYDGIARDRTQPRMLNETPAQLVAHLSHPNGWWRDTAQQLLVLKQDKSVVPALQAMARTSKNLLARFHALWTLEGLGALTPALTREALADPEPRMRIQALRASETLYKAGDRSFDNDYRALSKDTDIDVVIQSMLTMNVLKVADAPTTLKAVMSGNQARGVQFVADRILNAPAAAGRGGGRGGPPLTPEVQSSLERGGVIYTELCLLVPRRRRARHADAGSGGRFRPGAVAGRVGTRHRPSRLRDQDAAARACRSGGRQGLSAGHGRDGHEQGPVGCGHHLVCAQQLREHRHVRDNRRRREGSRLQRRSEDAVDRRRIWTRRCRACSSPMRRGK